MVKYLIVCLIFLTSINADELSDKIQNLIDSRTYKQNIDFINIIFSSKSAYYEGDNVDSVKVIKTLKDNRLLVLSYAAVHESTFVFKTSNSPILFIKIMKDALRNIGCYRYETKASSFDGDVFVWNISVKSKKIIDPEKLEKELNKNLCDIVDISRETSTKWTYTIDTQSAVLNVSRLQDDNSLKLKRSLYAKWVDISKVKKVHISSSLRNTWYPYIAYYDKSLNLIDVLKIDKKSDNLYLDFKENMYYIKISDIYTLKNIRDDLTLTPSAFR
jgi:hypothetical protein